MKAHYDEGRLNDIGPIHLHEAQGLLNNDQTLWKISALTSWQLRCLQVADNLAAADHQL